MFKKRTVIEVVMFLTYALFAMSWVAGSMMTKDVMSFYNIEGVAAATRSTNAITIAKIIGNLFAASVLVRLGPKKAFGLASLLIVAGGFGAFSSDYSLYVLGRAILGLGGAFIVVYFNPIVVHYFDSNERVVINGINAVAFNCGNLLAILFTGILLSYFEQWQHVILSISGISFSVLMMWWFVSDDFSLGEKGKRGEKGEPPPEEQYGLMDGLKEPFNWYLAIAYSGVLFCYLSAFTIFPLMPDFAVETSSLSLIMIVAAIVGTAFGISSAKAFPLRIPIIRYSGLAITFFVALMVVTKTPVLAYLSAFGAGFFMFMPMTALVTLPQELPGMTPGRITVVFSIFWSVSYSIETVLMYLVGVLADVTGNMLLAASFVVICSITMFVSSFFLPETGKSARLMTPTLA